MVVIGIIGGTGLGQDPNIVQNKEEVDLGETPFGRPCDTKALTGMIEGIKVYIIGRHGKNHQVNPSNVNYRANLWTLVKVLGCTHILATSACGSLKEAIMPGHLGILDQYFDRTKGGRKDTFYKVAHVQQGKPIDVTLQKFIMESCRENHVICHDDLKCVTIEGPRFSTKFESIIHRSWGCDVVNMTSVPEVPLAAELGIFYACIMLVTDYDCWKDDEEGVAADLVLERMKDLATKVRKIIPGVIRRIASHDWSADEKLNKQRLASAIMVE